MPGERARQPISCEEDEIPFPEAPWKTLSAVAVTPLAASQMVTTMRSSLDMAFSFRRP